MNILPGVHLSQPFMVICMAIWRLPNSLFIYSTVSASPFNYNQFHRWNDYPQTVHVLCTRKCSYIHSRKGDNILILVATQPSK